MPAPNECEVNQHTINDPVKKLKKGGYINQETRFNFNKKFNSESLIIVFNFANFSPVLDNILRTSILSLTKTRI